MSVNLAREIYNELKRFINTVDKDEAAETLVAVLIDNDIDAVIACWSFLYSIFLYITS